MAPILVGEFVARDSSLQFGELESGAVSRTQLPIWRSLRGKSGQFVLAVGISPFDPQRAGVSVV